MRWSQISEDLRIELYQRRYEDGESVSELADEVGMNPITLNRRLQEMHKDVAGDSTEEKATRQQDNFQVEHPDKNHMVVSGRVTSLDQLIESCKVDMNVWDVEHWIANTYEGYRKSDKKQLRWSSGSIQEGFIDDDGSFNTITLYQIKAWLVRKQPIAITPVVTPVSFPGKATWRSTVAKNSDFVRSSLIIPDVHMGFHRSISSGELVPMHDRRALHLVLQVAGQQQFDNVILVGDYFDLADWSDKFLRSPELEQVTQPAIEEGAWFLWQLRNLQPKAKFFFIEGNHEVRLRDAVIRHIPQAYKIKPAGKSVDYSAWSIPYLLGLDDLGVEWVGEYPNGIVWLEDNLCVIHGSDLNAEKIAMRSDVTVIFGHIHRADLATGEVVTGNTTRNVYAFCPGFLGRLDGMVPGHKNTQRWSQGFAVVNHGVGLEPQIVHIPIRNGRALYNGAMLDGQDYKDYMSKDVPGDWNF